MAGAPIQWQNKLPGNMGLGISSEATVNIRKKTIRIIPPLIAFSNEPKDTAGYAGYRNI